MPSGDCAMPFFTPSAFAVAVACASSAMAGAGATFLKRGMNLWKENRRRGAVIILIALALAVAGSVFFLYALSRGTLPSSGLQGL